MNVTCPECGTTYRVDPRKIPNTGLFARCARCPREFAIAVPVTEDRGAASEDLVAASVQPPDHVVTGADSVEPAIPEESWRVETTDESAWARDDAADANAEEGLDEGLYTADPTGAADVEDAPFNEGAADEQVGYDDRIDEQTPDDGAPSSEPEAWETGADSADYGHEASVEYGSPEAAGEEEPGLAGAEAEGYDEPIGPSDAFESSYAEPSVAEPSAELEAADTTDPLDAEVVADEPAPDRVDEPVYDTGGVDLQPDSTYDAGVTSPDAREGAENEEERAPYGAADGPSGTVDTPAEYESGAEPDEHAPEPPEPGAQEGAPDGVPSIHAPEEAALSAGFAATPARPTSEGELPPPPFGSSDPDARARRLARALVSDILVYHPDRRERSLREGTLRQEFREEIRKSWDEYVAHVGEQLARDTTYFRDALNELLAGGNRLF